MTCPAPDPSSYVITLCTSHLPFTPHTHLAHTGVDGWVLLLGAAIAIFAVVLGAALMFGAFLWRARKPPHNPDAVAAQSRPEPD